MIHRSSRPTYNYDWDNLKKFTNLAIHLEPIRIILEWPIYSKAMVLLKGLTDEKAKDKTCPERSQRNRYRISDQLWEKIKPFLPKHPNTHRFGGGRPRVPDRKAMNGVFFVLRTGCQWNALNETDICSSNTAHSRFQERTKAGVFQKLWALALDDYDELKGIDWSWQAMDATMNKAPLGEKTGPNFERTKALVEAVVLPVIASGGVNTVDDIEKLAELGAEATIIGRSLYEGTLKLSDAIKAAENA